MSHPPRLGPDGQPTEDVSENPMYVERLKREESERQRLEFERIEPWSRSKIERELKRLSEHGPSVATNGRKVRSAINLHGVDLSGQDLSGLDLSRANLHGAKLSGANMTGCRLVGTNLHGADLSGTALDSVNAVEANFHGACLCKADVSKTHFMKANLSEVCHESVVGLDLDEKPMTPAEVGQAKYRQSEGFHANILIDEGLVRYYGETLKGANVTGMSSAHKKRP